MKRYIRIGWTCVVLSLLVGAVLIGRASQQSDFQGGLTDLRFYERAFSRQLIWPDLAQGTQLVGGAGAYQLGTAANVVAASSIASPFVLTKVFLHDVSVADDYQINLYCSLMGTDSLICSVVCERGTAGSGNIAAILIPCPILPANCRISGAIASSTGGDNAYIKLGYQVH